IESSSKTPAPAAPAPAPKTPVTPTAAPTPVVAPVTPTVAPAPTPKTPAEILATMPNNIPQILREAVSEVVANEDEAKLFTTAWGIYENGTKVLTTADFNKIHGEMVMLTGIIKSSSVNADETREALRLEVPDSLKVFKTVITDKVEKKMKNEVETGDLQSFLLKVAAKDPVLQEKINKLFNILAVDPNIFTDPDDRDEIIDIQNEIEKALKGEIPTKLDNSINAGISLDQKLNKLKGFGRRDRRKLVTPLATALQDLDDEIADFEEIEARRTGGTSTPPPAGGAGTGTTSTPPPGPTTGATGPGTGTSASTATQGPAAAPNSGTSTGAGTPAAAPNAAPNSTTSTAPAAPNVVSQSHYPAIQSMMGEILADRLLYNVEGKPADPASLAIRELIADRMDAGNLDIAALKGFLQKPGLTVDAAIDKLANEKTPDELKTMLLEEERKYKKVEAQIKTLQSRMNVRGVTETERKTLETEVEGLYTQLHTADDQKNRITTAMNLQNGTMRYRSTKQVLAMVRLFIAQQDKEKLSQLDILNEVDDLIEAQRIEAHGRSPVSKFFLETLSLAGMLKPTLTATLRNLVQDPAFEKIGADKMADLAKAWNNKGAAEAWILSIEGNEDVKMTKTVPRLIAYLETALRNGNLRYINRASLGRIRGLLTNLKAIRHEHVTNQVDKLTTGKGMSDADVMSLYFKEMDKVTVSDRDIKKEIITRGAKWAIAKRAAKGVGVGALGAVGVVGGIGLAPVTAGVLGLGGASHYLLKSYGEMDEKAQAAYRKSALRIGWTGALATGALVINPLLAPLALGGVLAPEIGKLASFSHKHRKGIEKAGGATAKVGWKATKWGVPKALGIPEFGARFLAGGCTAFIGPLIWKKFTGKSWYAPRLSMALNNAVNA
ncbi:hypothetical protein KKA95_05135, partial [Patescibacteria group bacterium]|nr:hypothetical protein [Patescibacteria group bacterium]